MEKLAEAIRRKTCYPFGQCLTFCAWVRNRLLMDSIACTLSTGSFMLSAKSCKPVERVSRVSPVARATSATPRYPSPWASVAAHKRRARS